MSLITVNMNALIKYKNSLIAKTLAICIYETYWNNKDIASVRAKDIPFVGKNGSRNYFKYILSVFLSN